MNCSHEYSPQRCSALEVAVHLSLSFQSPSPLLSAPSCSACTDSVAVMCLDCVTFSCANEQHVAQHFSQSKHSLFFDCRTLSIVCMRCRKYLNDPYTDLLIRQARADFDNLIPVQSLAQVRPQLESQSNDRQRDAVLDDGRLGLRGLYNLGNTCFMSAVLQALLHNPFVKQFFLSDAHLRKSCDSKEALCLACEFDDLTQQSFTTDTFPLIPHRFLYTMWQFAETMAGYEQQDAHEFLMSVLDGLHLALAPSDNLSHPCPCLVHSVFSSSLRSTLTCCACDGISVAVDPIMDISLDLKGSTVLSEEKDIFSVPNETMGLLSVGLSADEGLITPAVNSSNSYLPGLDFIDTKPLIALPTINDIIMPDLLPPADLDPLFSNSMLMDSEKKKGSAPLPMGTSNLNSVLGSLRIEVPVPALVASLEECLDKFTQAEQLGDKFMCQSCKSFQTFNKRLSFNTLPHVICFQMKRFEHHGMVKNKRTSSKIDMYVRFPLRNLDMAPYLSTFNRSHAELFDLFSVVVHHGSLDSGHYISYVRHHQNWYKCDDATVTRVQEDEVLRCQAYLMFYVRQSVQYAS